MKYDTKQDAIAEANRLGSTAATFAGAFRFLRGHSVVHSPLTRYYTTPRREVTPLPRGCYRERGIILSVPRREWTPAEAWHTVQSRTRWEARQDRMAREEMAAGRYLPDRRRKPVAILDRAEYSALADATSILLGLPSIPECEDLAASLTRPYLTHASAALETAWPYRRSTSSWAGGEHDVSVRIDTICSAHCETAKVWSDNGKWSGSNSSATITTDIQTLQLFPTLMTSDGLALCRARKIGTREYEITWIEQSTGVSLKTVDGYLIRGYHVAAATIEQARKKAAKARSAALAAAVRARDARRTKRTGLATVRGIWLDVADSLAAGNCRATTEQFAATMWRELGASGPCAVRADVVLMERDDYYTRRALGVAINRQAVA